MLRIHPDILRAHERIRAAELLSEANAFVDSSAPIASDLQAQAAAAGRQVHARRILGIFSTAKQRDDIERRVN